MRSWDTRRRVVVVWLAGMLSSALVTVQLFSLILLQSVQVTRCDHGARPRCAVGHRFQRWSGVRRSSICPAIDPVPHPKMTSAAAGDVNAED